jgi:hypothetical protein
MSARSTSVASSASPPSSRGGMSRAAATAFARARVVD